MIDSTLSGLFDSSARMASAMLRDSTPFEPYLEQSLLSDLLALRKKGGISSELLEDFLPIVAGQIKHVFSTGGVILPPSHNVGASKKRILARSALVAYFREIGLASKQYHEASNSYGLTARDLFLVPNLYFYIQKSEEVSIKDTFFLPSAELVSKYEGFLAIQAPVECLLRSALAGPLIEGCVSYGDTILIAQGN